MARVQTVSLVDDLDGSEADGTLSFGLDGRSYEIDLNEKHADELRELLAPFVAGARRSGQTATSRRTTRPVTSASDRERNAAIRSWAKENGFGVSERGRLSSNVIEAYENRRGTPAPAAEEKPKRSRKKVDA